MQSIAARPIISQCVLIVRPVRTCVRAIITMTNISIKHRMVRQTKKRLLIASWADSLIVVLIFYNSIKSGAGAESRTLVPTLGRLCIAAIRHPPINLLSYGKWSHLGDSNSGPPLYESDALAN